MTPVCDSGSWPGFTWPILWPPLMSHDSNAASPFTLYRVTMLLDVLGSVRFDFLSGASAMRARSATTLLFCTGSGVGVSSGASRGYRFSRTGAFVVGAAVVCPSAVVVVVVVSVASPSDVTRSVCAVIVSVSSYRSADRRQQSAGRCRDWACFRWPRPLYPGRTRRSRGRT